MRPVTSPTDCPSAPATASAARARLDDPDEVEDHLPQCRGVLVHDSLPLYNGYPHARHRLCGAHLARELTAAAEDHPVQRWPAQIRWALAELNKHPVKARESGLTEIPPERARIYLESFHRG
nr:transposase [Microbispora cellulosiformans]